MTTCALIPILLNICFIMYTIRCAKDELASAQIVLWMLVSICAAVGIFIVHEAIKGIIKYIKEAHDER